ncbi:MAG: hypothetical protein ABIB79_03250, partial [archaeon]
FCVGNRIYNNLIDYFCNLGECMNSEVMELQEDCDNYDGYSLSYCINNSIYRNFNDYFCVDGGCDYSSAPEFVEDCVLGCTEGICDPYCGDGSCNGDETCEICESDCGVCPYCGDGTCNGGESCETCESDCGACIGCGNLLCEDGEDCNNCESDCGPCEGTYCIDSDGGQVYDIFGVTSYRTVIGIEYVYEDTCPGSNLLIEWYCSGDLGYVQYITCTTKGYTGCVDGRCV